MASTFLKAEWRKLAMANYAIDPAVLKKFTPYKTELDNWNGNHYVSLVGFMFLNTRVKGISIPFHKNFEEVNLRFYVRYKTTSNEWKRGTVFIKEIVPKFMITVVANTLFSEHYHTMPMKHVWRTSPTEIEVEYSWDKRPHSIKVICDPIAKEILDQSEEEFITEHYWGYTMIDAKHTSEYAVEHPRWQVYKVIQSEISVDFGLYGNEFRFLNQQVPSSVFLAEGSEVIVRNGTKV